MERSLFVRDCVLDTSVIIKWFSEYDENDLENALNLRLEIVNGNCAVIVPDLLFYELSNALRYNSNFTADDVKDAVKTVIDMGFDVRSIDPEIIQRAIDIGFQYNVAVYDAYFPALSKTEKKPFITADYKFYEKAKKFKNIIRLSHLY